MTTAAMFGDVLVASWPVIFPDGPSQSDALAFASSSCNPPSHPRFLDHEITLPASCHWLLNPPMNTQHHGAPSRGNYTAGPRCSPDLESLQSVIQTSRRIWQSFKDRETWIVLQILKRDIPRALWFDAEAAMMASQISSTSWSAISTGI